MAPRMAAFVWEETVAGDGHVEVEAGDGGRWRSVATAAFLASRCEAVGAEVSTATGACVDPVLNTMV